MVTRSYGITQRDIMAIRGVFKSGAWSYNEAIHALKVKYLMAKNAL